MTSEENSMYSRVNVLGVMINPVDLEDAINTIKNWIQNQEANYICVTSAHGVLECQDDAQLKSIFNQSGLTTPDGMSIVWILRILGNKNVDRVYGPDLMKAVCNESLYQGWKHYLYGGEPGVVEVLSERLNQTYPGLRIVGSFTPPFRDLTHDEERLLLQQIQVSQPDIIWVGLSTPKQERWMANYVNKLPGKVFIGVGAAFDFLSGKKRQAPRWIQRSGIEWLFRLITEPRRLWKRYLQYPRFVMLVTMQLLRLKRHDNG
jgi:N-acetylglucosaminyldiphosphoundecaprenol N-acetyl-beta-D-mannosaminyltransferase